MKRIDAIAFSAYTDKSISSRQIIEAMLSIDATILDGLKISTLSDPYSCIDAGNNIMLQGLSHSSLRREELQGTSIRSGTATLGYSSAEQWLFISQSSAFTKKADLDALADGLATFAALLSRVIRLEYGWLDRRRSILPNLKHAAEGSLEYICWYNYFGPRILRAVGLETLTNAPVESVESDDAGGVSVRITSDYTDWVQNSDHVAIEYFRGSFPEIRHYSISSKGRR